MFIVYVCLKTAARQTA